MRININITASDIRHGVRQDCGACPIARAASRHCKKLGAIRVRAGIFWLTFYKTKETHEEVCDAMLPTIARRFLRAFDDKRKVAPFRFTVTLSS